MNPSICKYQWNKCLIASLDDCMKAVSARSGSIFLFDNKRKELVLEIVHHQKNIPYRGIRQHLGERVAGKVALERKPLLVEDIDQQEAFQYLPQYSHYQSKSFLSVPIQCNGDLIGVLNLTDKSDRIAFNHTDLLIVLNIAKALGTVLNTLKEYAEREKKLKEELERLQQCVERSEKFSSLGKLVGGLVHEINNPLDGVIRYVNLGYICAEEEGIIKEYLGEAKQGLSRIAKIIRSLLDFSWSLGGHEGKHEGKVDINLAIEESLFMLNHYIISAGIQIEKSLASGLPKFPDYGLNLALNNVLKNACEAMKNGGVLTILTEMGDNEVIIKISDTGEGIPVNIQNKIFEPFFTTKGMGEGSGLGLAISYEIVRRYNGNIVVESQPHGGATFIIHLPCTFA